MEISPFPGSSVVEHGCKPTHCRFDSGPGSSLKPKFIMIKELVISNEYGQKVTTSLIVAESFQKSHAKVLRDIDKISCSPEFWRANFGFSDYEDTRGKTQPMYYMTKDGFLFLTLGYTGHEAGLRKELFLNAWNDLVTLAVSQEQALNNDDYILDRALHISMRRMKSLEEQIVTKNKQIELGEHTIKEQAPKVEYFDDVLKSESLITTTLIAKDLGMNARALNRLLHDKKIHYKCQGVWVLTAKYEKEGYTRTKTHKYEDSCGVERTELHTYWTEKGRAFVINIFKQAA